MDNAARSARIQDIGEALYGERWQRPLARDLGVSIALISAIANGSRRATPDLEERLERVIVNDLIPQLQAAIEMLKAHACDIAAELQLD